MLAKKSKLIEFCAQKHDAYYNNMLKATEITKDFIRKYNLIIYGGTAIDYAMHLVGSQIYPDDALAVPDLDFYSPNSVEHSNELAYILYEAGFNEVRAITAEYVRARKVDIGDNHWIADIAYMPQNIFDIAPTLVYEGMRIIHPYFQYIDVHTALSNPFGNAPRENMFHRWSKDVERYNIMYAAYPLVVGSSDEQNAGKQAQTNTQTHTRTDKQAKKQEQTQEKGMRKVSVPLKHINGVLGGYAAFAALSTSVLNSANKNSRKNDKEVRMLITEIEELCNATCSVTRGDKNVFTFDSPAFQSDQVKNSDINKDAKGEVFIMTTSMAKSIEKVRTNSADEVRAYEPHFNLIPKRKEITVSGVNYVFASSKNKLIAISSLTIDSAQIRVTSPQFVMIYMLARWFIHKEAIAARAYSAIRLLTQLEELLDLPDAARVMRLTMNVYGNENISLSREIQLIRLYSDIKGEKTEMLIPINHYPARFEGREGSEEIKKHGTPFNYDESEFFCESGRLIKRKSKTSDDTEESHDKTNGEQENEQEKA